MQEIQLGEIESRFADIIWEREPVSSSELVKICSAEFGWARTTTHNVIRKLVAKGLISNNKGTVTSLISRDKFYSLQTVRFVNDSFEGSLPAFIAAFTKGKRLSSEEAAEIRKLIDEVGED